MFGGAYDYEDSNGQEWQGLPHDPNEDFGSNDAYLAEIGEQQGWATWSDFYEDKLGLSNDNPEASRPPYLGDIDGLIIDLYERGILDYALFEFNGDYIDYEIDVES